MWLKDAGVALPIYSIDTPKVPLLASKNSNTFRLFSSDVGLLTSCYPTNTKFELINNNGEVNNGAHFENAVAQQLIANGLEPYYFKKQNIGEIDFLVEINGKVLPIEVKSGKSYKTHKAIDNLLAISGYHINEGYVLSIGNIEKEDKLTYIPIYMSYLIKERSLDKMIVDVDTKGL